ncbi:MAG TPA: cyclic nucleotide-binding domain-containing protein [Kineosporiaceae bacterium]|nr:cyclic nucleotide-binding domain-containing protein [Kineosporiaceae bacterium]
MDTTRFFDYPDGQNPGLAPETDFLSAADDADWVVIFEHGQTRRYAPGSQLVGADETDRALYLVLEGTLVAGPAQAPRRGPRRGHRRRPDQPMDYGPGAILGERGFLEGRPFETPVQAVTSARVLRLGLTEFEVLAAKDPALGRYLLFDLARVLAARADRLLALARPDR